MGQPAIQWLQRVSKPGRRVYLVRRSCRACATVPVSRSFDAQGRSLDAEAREQNVGGVCSAPCSDGGRTMSVLARSRLPPLAFRDARRRAAGGQGPQGSDVLGCGRSGLHGRRQRHQHQPPANTRVLWACSAVGNRLPVWPCIHRGLEISASAPRQRSGSNLKLQLGYSHDVDFRSRMASPSSARIRPRSRSAADKQQVGQVAAEIRRWRKPEPYKGKGIKYRGEFIFRKEGKKK